MTAASSSKGKSTNSRPMSDTCRGFGNSMISITSAVTSPAAQVISSMGPASTCPGLSGNSAGRLAMMRCASPWASWANSSLSMEPSRTAALNAFGSLRRLTASTPPTPETANPNPIWMPGGGKLAHSMIASDSGSVDPMTAKASIPIDAKASLTPPLQAP